ncbi:MetQ/NlpA family lipoprotein [Burkholderia plantarii]|uniref:MetQ/NlpA family lipoprotein n=1 Tax=Burkholderia plantarii TaxID=41899 RepID=UPI0018DB2D89|nr:MetQ/NlpA family lipoprotein [Burkholderia plantarii]MBI0329599.1 MetQ/NlpA family lipoprotein [Burkholderia plantarii]
MGRFALLRAGCVGWVGALLAVAGQAAAASDSLAEPLGLVAPVPAPLRIGVTSGPQAGIFAEVKRVAAARGLPLDVVVFDDATRIDAALAAGRLDAASFEDAHQLAATRRAHGYALGYVATTATLPLALYSRRLTGLNQLQPGARVVIPAEPRAASRALVLLQNETLLTLRDSAGLDATPHDVIGNRLGLRIVTRPARQLFAALDDAALVAMDRETAARAGLQPGRDSIGIEDARSPFADVLTVRDVDRARPWVRELIAACHSDEVAHFILVRYQDSVRRPW